MKIAGVGWAVRLLEVVCLCNETKRICLIINDDERACTNLSVRWMLLRIL